ncbi:hypothetical protein H8A97_15480 [Bradyrhizobium sp. Arg62]|uniref:terminase large subunit domain-containing protein n=1 Tax=Bradyrhizobium brasilense TaxID=1419277 RepID=UPI001E58411E|nr:terminase large subunit [Bradyrhizobium brasilense]MCC8946477.1 hypothetical protein [Bradyrhizobium brasilense]
MKRRLVRERLEDPKPAPRFKLQPPEHRLTLLDAVRDPQIFLPSFADPDDWEVWWAFIASCFAYDMTPEQRALFEKCTGRKVPPAQQVKEAWLVVGRRGGKSRVLALIAVWLACFFNYKPFIARGQRAVVQVMAADREQCQEIMNYVKGFLSESKMLRRLVESSTAKWVRLKNSISIEVTTASYKTSRGRTVVCLLADELAFWSSDDTSSNPDTEVIAAARPSMLTIPNSMMLCASSPHSRRGALWQAYKKHYGQQSDRILVWQADTLTMRPHAPDYIRAEIDQAYQDDPSQASANFGGLFRTDLEQLLSIEALDAVTSDERERPYMPQFNYSAFCDPSGGGSDSFTLAIGHRENGVAVLDLVREKRPPFSPEEVVAEYAAELKAYGISSVKADRYALEWVREAFKKQGITLEHSEKSKSEIYRELLPLINSKKCDLLDHQRLHQQLLALERRTSRSGREQIDHPVNGKDDLANSAAGCLVCMGTRRYRYVADLSWVGGPSERSYAAERLSTIMAMKGL